MRIEIGKSTNGINHEIGTVPHYEELVREIRTRFSAAAESRGWLELVAYSASSGRQRLPTAISVDYMERVRRNED